jgi:hypothetical protein
VTDAFGDGQVVQVDFEVVSGPGDDDVGTAGDTPETPDMSCTTNGGGAGAAATCTVSYTETDNVAGDDAILAWVDEDGGDGTVEADTGEGLSTTGGGSPGCDASSNGAGTTAEPDNTDCVSRTWTERTGVAVDVQPESAAGSVGSTMTLSALVVDGSGPIANASVRWFFMGGSANDPHSPGNSPDMRCKTNSLGECSVSYVPSDAGTDTICAIAAGPKSRCNEAVGAP